MSVILAIETATHACSVALSNGQQLWHRREVAARRHGELLLPWIDSLMREAGLQYAELDAIAVSRGPGAFTGVRMGIAVAQGLAMAERLPVLPVSALAACAHGAWRMHQVSHSLVAFDARMGELYWAQATVQAQGRVVLTNESVVKPAEIVWPSSGQWQALSDGWKAYPELLQQAAVTAELGLTTMLPDAQDVLLIAQHLHQQGHGISAMDLEPVYLRNNVAQTPKRSLLS